MPIANLYAILSVLVVSLISLVGVFTISIHSRWGEKFLHLMVSFAAGALLGDVFIHLLPELSAGGKLNLQVSLIILASIIAFFTTERFLHWHHHHHETAENEQRNHPVVLLNLVGDGMHNIIDGLIIGGAYLIDIKLGFATTLAVILHEIPQEIGDFGVLIYGGLSRNRALLYNFLSAITSIIGVIIALTVGNVENFAYILVAIGIGSFIYISVADLIPEIHKSKTNILPQSLAMLFGIGIMFALLLLE
ncbi:MAG: ZIP family metal transporter [Candidatus Doudnabacteria bacterium]